MYFHWSFDVLCQVPMVWITIYLIFVFGSWQIKTNKRYSGSSNWTVQVTSCRLEYTSMSFMLSLTQWFLFNSANIFAGSRRVCETGLRQYWHPRPFTRQRARGTNFLFSSKGCLFMITMVVENWRVVIINRLANLFWRHRGTDILRRCLHQVTPSFLYSSILLQ